MILQDNQYAAFLADYAAGQLSCGETLAAQLHFRLSRRGAQSGRMLDAAGGALLEATPPGQPLARDPAEPPSPPPPGEAPDAISGEAEPDWLEFYTREDLSIRQWRKSLFGVKTMPTHLRTASLLRLDPGERAPRHSHGRRDVTVVLRGAFADDWGEYRRGDLAFADAGDSHAPATLGEETCICLIATPNGRPTVDLRGLLARWWSEKGDRQ